MKSLQVYILAICCLPLGIYANIQHGLHNDWSSGLRIIYTTYKQCQQNDLSMWPCLKQRALKLIDRAINMETIPLIDGISVQRDKVTNYANFAMDSQARSSSNLDDLLWERITEFVKSHSLRLKLPIKDIKLTIDEGRGKLKKIAGPIALGLMMKGMLAALGLGALAMLAGKALLVSKLALALSLIIAAKKLFGGGGGGGGGNSHHETYEIVAKHPHHHEGSSSNQVANIAEPNQAGYFGHRRSLLIAAVTPASASHPDINTSAQAALDVNSNYTTEGFAQMMAYRAYRPTDPTVPTTS